MHMRQRMLLCPALPKAIQHSSSLPLRQDVDMRAPVTAWQRKMRSLAGGSVCVQSNPAAFVHSGMHIRVAPSCNAADFIFGGAALQLLAAAGSLREPQLTYGRSLCRVAGKS